jgi:hypothetical protein
MFAQLAIFPPRKIVLVLVLVLVLGIVVVIVVVIVIALVLVLEIVVVIVIASGAVEPAAPFNPKSKIGNPKCSLASNL